MMHIVSTAPVNEIASVCGPCSEGGGRTSGNFLTSSPDILCLQAALGVRTLGKRSGNLNALSPTEKRNLS
jgi:hypothetical protein